MCSEATLSFIELVLRALIVGHVHIMCSRYHKMCMCDSHNAHVMSHDSHMILVWYCRIATCLLTQQC